MSELRIPLGHSLPGKPNNNSLAERTNQEVINTVSTALLHAGFTCTVLDLRPELCHAQSQHGRR